MAPKHVWMQLCLQLFCCTVYNHFDGFSNLLVCIYQFLIPLSLKDFLLFKLIKVVAFWRLNWSLVCVQTLFCFIIVLFTLGSSTIRLFTFENKRFFIEKGDERVNSQRFQGKLKVFSVFFIVKISWNIRRNIRLLYQILFVEISVFCIKFYSSAAVLPSSLLVAHNSKFIYIHISYLRHLLYWYVWPGLLSLFWDISLGLSLVLCYFSFKTCFYESNLSVVMSCVQ